MKTKQYSKIADKSNSYLAFFDKHHTDYIRLSTNFNTLPICAFLQAQVCLKLRLARNKMGFSTCLRDLQLLVHVCSSCKGLLVHVQHLQLLVHVCGSCKEFATIGSSLWFM